MEELWVQEPGNRITASFGTNIGFFTGYPEVVRHFVTEYEQKEAVVMQAFKDAGRKDVQPGIGMTATHSCTTPLL